ncbi:hypothetical protein EC973_001187 [Apophysomyces ossiformis]|uniref:Uncharacterized protein n=1 Tax=Apophysomyces ossiformis TaxID=679940 RepID=A0A8H7BPP2_9FUNG|nr:hypothetical protein EC973_001187 [Apophysomyces ossiformis]
MSMASSELMDTTTSKNIESLQEAATASTTAVIASNPSPTTATASHTTAPEASASHPSVPATSTEHNSHLAVENNILTISRVAIDDNTIGEPWIVNDKNQQAIHEMVDQHTTLPLESYIQELAALTHILVVCKNQYSTIVEKMFTLDLLVKNYMTINTHITQISESTTPDRERVIVALTNMYPNLSYGEKRIIMGINNLIQKLPITPLNDLTTMSESKLWSTYFDPMLSVLISDPEKLIHLRWTNTIPAKV